MISVFSRTAKTEKELAGVGYPILDRWAKSATLKATLNGEQYITVTIPHKAEGVKRHLIPGEFDILKIQDMEDEDDYYRIGKPRYTLNSTTLTAEHISYDLIDNIIEDINIIGLNGQQAMDRISKGTQYSHPFLLRSNIGQTANIRMVRMNPIQALIGNADNTFLSRFGGELRRRRFTLTINDRVGIDRTEVIRSKKNLSGFERDIDIDNIVTRIMPKAENGILLPEKYVDSPLIEHYPHPKIRVIEYKTGYEGEFKDLSDADKEAVYQKLREFTRAEFENGIDKPKATYKVSFVPLSKTKEYESYRFMEAINLGDKVGVYEESYDVYIEARVIEIEWDILNKKYISITLGSFQDSLAKSSVNQNSSIASQLQDVKETANLAMASADGKATNFYGFNEPSNPRLGDTWFKRNGEETEIWQYEEVDGVAMWVYKVGPQHAKDIEQRIKDQFEAVRAKMAESETERQKQIDELLLKAGANKSLAEEAKKIGDQAKLDAASSLSKALQYKAEAIAEANRLIASARQTLDGQFAQQAQQLLTQASAQEQLTRRTSAVEQLANSTKTTLTELSKTVNDQTGQIDSVSQRTRIVEDGIAELTTKYENFTIGTKNLIPSSRTMSGNGWYTDGATLEGVTVDGYPFTFKRWTSGNKNSPIIEIDVKANMTYTFTAYIARENVGRLYFYLYDLRHHHITSATPREAIIDNVGPEIQRFKVTFTPARSGIIRPRFAMLASDAGWMMTGGFMLVQGAVSGDYGESDLDIIAEQALYKQTVEQNLAEISRQTQTTAGDVSQLKTFREQTVSQLRDVVSASQFDSLTGRMTQLETDITTQAGELAKRLTRTQVEQAITDRGYQTKSQVDSNIAGRGYITSSALQPYATATTVQNLVRETAGSFERSITETKALIPTATSVNLVDGTKDFSGSHFWINGNWRLDGRTVAGADVLTWQSGDKASPTLTWQVEAGKEYIFSAYVAKQTTGTVYFYLYNFGGDDITSTTRRNHHIDDVGADFKRFTLHFVPTRSGKIRARFAIMDSDVGGFSVAGYQLLEGRLEQPWGPSAKELSAVTGFNSVKDTVDAHKRLIGDGSSISQAIQSASKFERSIASGGDIYQAIETAKGLVQEVTGANGLKTQMSQLAGSWAVKNLTSAGTVLNQINLMANGTNRIDGRLTHITGSTLIDRAVIKDAHIASVSASKMTTGMLDAGKVNVINLNANKIVGLDANFIKAKIESAMIDWMKGKTISAQSDAMKIDLNGGQMLYYTDQAAMKRILSGYPTQFVKFATGTVEGKGLAGVTVIGSNRNGTESSNDGGFVGIRAWNGSNIDSIDVVGDHVRLASSAYNSADGWDIITLPNRLEIDAYNANHRASSRVKVGDVWLWKNSSTYSSLRDTINSIIDNLILLHNNKTTERGYRYAVPAKV